MAVRVDADAAFEQAADARPLMPVQIGAAARREGDAVAAQKQGAFGKVSSRAESFSREMMAVPARGDGTGIARRKLPAPDRRSSGAGFEPDGAFAAQAVVVV